MNYSVAAVSRLTQLSPDVLRAWERRYGIVTPARDRAGTRRYSARDVERLRLAAAATALGHPIRSVAMLSAAELRKLIGAPQHESGSSSSARLVDKIVRAVESSDAVLAERAVAAAAGSLPVRTLVLDVLAPALRRIGEAWACGRASLWQEHLLSALVRNAGGRAALPPGAPMMVMVTPPFESHGFGNVFAAMLASARGIRAINLGTQVPAAEAVAAAGALQAEIVVASMLGAIGTLPEARAYAVDLATALPPHVELVLGGPLGARAAEGLAPDRVRAVETLEQFDALVEAWCKARRARPKKRAARAPVAQLG
jgi:MerR family transcriptional regulator, light-induced transcriptional regulator